MRLKAASIVLAFLCLMGLPARAASLNYCDPGQLPNADAQDRMLRVAAIVKRELEASGQQAALVSRSGLSLSWMGLRYSHSGVSSRANTNGPWSVRQLYYACDEKTPRIFDQGMSGFVVGGNAAALGYVSLVTLPTQATQKLEAALLNNATALALLGRDYSANAYPYSTQYQNCNQWTAELLAAAWRDAPAPPDRQEAQAWLQAQGYQPTELRFLPPLWIFGRLSSWLNFDDHPQAQLSQGSMLFSMPRDLERFARKLWPEAQRIEICYSSEHVVIHHGWDNLPDNCQALEGDQVIALTAPAAGR